MVLLFLVVIGAASGSVAALRADSGSTHASPSAPGATAIYTVTVVAERGDAVTRGGLEQIGLNFDADSDFSGRLDTVTARDVTVRVRNRRTGETRRGGPVQVAANATRNRVWIGLRSVSQVEPGDEIVVEIADVTNTEIAIDDPSGPRGFALNVSVANPQGQVDGPVETRYSIDPNASVNETANGTVSNATTRTTAATTDAGTGATTKGTETSGSTGDASPTGTTSGESSTDTAGTEPTETSGPGFGVVVGVVVVLVVGLFVSRRE